MYTSGGVATSSLDVCMTADEFVALARSLRDLGATKVSTGEFYAEFSGAVQHTAEIPAEPPKKDDETELMFWSADA